MAYVSSNSVKAFIAEETVAGQLATTGLLWEVPRKAGSGLPTVSGGEITSDTIRPGLNGNGSRRGIKSVTHSIEMNAITADYVDFLLENLLNNSFDESGVLKASDKEFKTFSYITEIATGKYDVALGCVVNSFNLRADAASLVTMTFGMVGVDSDNVTALTGLTPTAVPLTAYEYDGSEVLGLTVAGASAMKYSTLDLQIGSPRNARNGLSSNASLGFSSGTREVTATFSVWRDPAVDYEAIFTGQPQEFSFDLGIASYGRKHTVYGTASLPQTSTGDDLMIDVTITGKLNSTQGTAYKIAKL